ncbi:MAG TPA: hypothetical protein VMW76_01695 [Bacteroidales bacterium]|nr:hypothetical protein [Bacteroidales bacterium]
MGPWCKGAIELFNIEPRNPPGDGDDPGKISESISIAFGGKG